MLKDKARIPSAHDASDGAPFTLDSSLVAQVLAEHAPHFSLSVDHDQDLDPTAIECANVLKKRRRRMRGHKHKKRLKKNRHKANK